MSAMEPITCGECGIAFGVPALWLQAKRDNGKSFWCPNGHARVFRESTADKLQRELNKAKQREAMLISERDVAQREADRERAARKRVETRVSNGVCPDCNRSFPDLHRHMQTQHGGRVCEPVQPPKPVAGRGHKLNLTAAQRIERGARLKAGREAAAAARAALRPTTPGGGDA